MTLEISPEKLNKACQEAGIDLKKQLAMRAFKDTRIHRKEWTSKTAKENLSRYISHDRTPTLEDLNDIAHALKKEIWEICVGDPDEGIEAIYRQQILSLYGTLEQGHVISIVSADGFLEAEVDDKEIFPQMVDTIRKKVDVRYYYPRGPRSKSQSDYVQLLAKYKKELGHETIDKHVSGYAVPASQKQIFGWSTRYVVISKWNTNAGEPQQMVEHVFLYTQTEALSENKRIGKAVDVWLRLGKNMARKYYSELCAVAEPLANLGIYTNRLRSKIQEFYRTQFANFIDVYIQIRKTASSQKVLCSTLDYIFSKGLKKWSVPDPKGPVFRVLDIGSGDGISTATALRVLKSKLMKGCVLSLTTVESSLIPPDSRHNCLTKPLTTRITGTFEDWEHEGQPFDLILMIHSMYLIDPMYLLKAYELLTDTGVLVVIASPCENNFLNCVCSTVDKLLPTIEPSIERIKPYTGKKVTEDPFRNYAEDLHAIIEKLFGKAFDKLTFKQELKLPLFMDKDNRFTELGRDIVRLFGNNLVGQKTLRTIEKIIAKKVGSDPQKSKVRNDTWALVLSKKVIRESAGKTVNGEIV
jgi:hypothetical protein